MKVNITLIYNTALFYVLIDYVGNWESENLVLEFQFYHLPVATSGKTGLKPFSFPFIGL